MSKYKTGDKVVLEIIQDDSYGDYKVGNKTHSWWNSHELLDNGSVPLSKYIKSMEEKLHNQRVEINRLLEENKELKINANWCDNCAKADSIDEARAAGQEEAWKLAHKISGMGFDEAAECFPDYDFPLGMRSLTKKYSYTEAAAKVAEWEQKKEEICVGDVVECEGTYIVVVGVGEWNIKGFTSDLTPFQWMKQDCTKTGRHIDVDAWMAQIGGESK